MKLDRLIQNINLSDITSPSGTPDKGDRIAGVLPEELQRLYHLYVTKSDAVREAAKAVVTSMSPGGTLHKLVETHHLAHEDGTTKDCDCEAFHKALEDELLKPARAGAEADSMKDLFWSLVRLEFDLLGEPHLSLGDGWTVIVRAKSKAHISGLVIGSAVGIPRELAELLASIV